MLVVMLGFPVIITTMVSLLCLSVAFSTSMPEIGVRNRSHSTRSHLRVETRLIASSPRPVDVT